MGLAGHIIFLVHEIVPHYFVIHLWQDENEAGRVAKLFPSQLSSTVRIKKEFLPALRAFATSGWEAIEPVAIYMFGMLLHKLQKRGVTLVTATLPTNVSLLSDEGSYSVS